MIVCYFQQKDKQIKWNEWLNTKCYKGKGVAGWNPNGAVWS